MDPRHVLGDFGETLAEAYLVEQGFRIVERQFETEFGEIDLVTRHQDAWVFVEVKTREGDQLTSAAEAITAAKQRKLIRSAIVYLNAHRLRHVNVRFDVVLIETGSIEWIPNAFQAPSIYTL